LCFIERLYEASVHFKLVGFMGILMADNSKQSSNKTDSVVKRAAEATANGVYSVTHFVARNDDRVADATQAATQALGVGLDKTGRVVSGASEKAAKALHGNADRAADTVENFIRGDGQRVAYGKVPLFSVGLQQSSNPCCGFLGKCCIACR
jgi:hypothetical protein